MSAVTAFDPGVSGGLVVMRLSGEVAYIRGFAGLRTQKELVAVVKVAAGLMMRYEARSCYAEKVGFKKGDGGKGANTFGRVDGLLRGAALALDLDLFDVSPMMWQSRMGCLTGGNKNVSKNRALVLWPHLAKEITHQTADALLIAEYGRQLQLQRA